MKSFLRLTVNDPIYILNDDHTSYITASVESVILNEDRSVFLKSNTGETYLIKDNQSDQVFLDPNQFPSLKRKRFEKELDTLMKQFKLIPKEIIDEYKS